MSDAFQFIVLAGKRTVYRAEVMADDPVSLRSITTEALANQQVFQDLGVWTAAFVYAAEEQKNGDILRVDPVGEPMEDFARVMGWINA